MTQKHKDSQKAGLASYSKMDAKRQNQKGVPANLKPNNNDDAQSALSSVSAGKSSSSREEYGRLQEEFERAKQAWALEKQTLEQDRQIQADHIQAMQESMGKNPDMSTTSATKTTNVVTDHKSTSFASPASFLLYCNYILF